MNLEQFFKHLAEADETIREQLQRLYDVYKRPDSTLTERNEFMWSWIEHAGPMLAALETAENVINDVGFILGDNVKILSGDTPASALERLIAQHADLVLEAHESGRSEAFAELRELIGCNPSS